MQRTNYALNIYRSIAKSVYIKCEDSLYDTVKLIAVLSFADEMNSLIITIAPCF